MNTGKAMPLTKLVVGGGVLGVMLAAVVVVIWLLRKRMGKESSVSAAPSPYAMAIALESVLKGQDTYDELGKLIYDAVSMGNFSAYKGAHATMREITTTFPETTAQDLVRQVRDEVSMRRRFDALRTELQKLPGEFMGIEHGGESRIEKAGQPPIILLKQTFAYIESPGKPPQQLPLGVMLKAAFGWKLLPSFDKGTGP